MKTLLLRSRRTGWLAGILLAAIGPVWAGGPTAVAPDGRPYAWTGAGTIPYTMDPGPLGAFSNIQASQWVADAFNAWASVEGAQLTIRPTAPHSSDVTGRNVLDVLDARPDTVSLVILDSDGSVLDELFGSESSQFLAGVGYPELFDTRNARILQATAIISGLDSRLMRPEWFRGPLIEHELGHFLGLTHSQLNPDVARDGDPNNDALAPRMSYNEGPNAGPGLHVEDRGWIAALYPRTGAAPSTGTIRGRVLLPDGATGLQGIQVVARREGDERVTAVSGVSGYRYKGSGGEGSRDTALIGLYELPGLPPGSYRLAIEQLSDDAFVDPGRQFLPGGRRFWRETRPLVTRSEEATLVAVTAGQTLEGRDFVLDGAAATPRTVAEIEPNPLPETAATILLPAIVNGRVGTADQALLEVEKVNGDFDAVEDFHRLVVTEPILLTATLTTANPALDTQLYVVRFPEDANTVFPFLEAESADRGTPPETVQTRLWPGVYFLAVSSPDEGTVANIDYQLTVLATPAPEAETVAVDPPRITFATVSHLTQTSLRVRVQTDREANAVLLVERPQREFGDPALTREHTLAVTGLARRTGYFLDLTTYLPSGESDALPRLLVFTPTVNNGSTPRLFAGLSSARALDQGNREFLVVASVLNVGDAAAANVRVTRLALPEGWRYIGPPPVPLELGAIGSDASALLLARVEKTSESAAPLDIGIQGTYESVTGSTLSFGR
jgi:hypothetical protein